MSTASILGGKEQEQRYKFISLGNKKLKTKRNTLFSSKLLVRVRSITSQAASKVIRNKIGCLML